MEDTTQRSYVRRALRRPTRFAASGGSTLLSAMIIIAILVAIAATILYAVSARHRNSYHASAWREALNSAESGLDRAMSELAASIKNPYTAWNGWVVVDANGNPTDAPLDKDGHWAVGYAVRMTDTLPAQTGERSQPRYSVTIDVPATLASSSRHWNQSYRIRSTGLADLPVAARLTPDKRDTHLRKLSLVWQRISGGGERVTTPQATRTIEAIAKPESVYDFSLIADINFRLSRKTFIDGYNSFYPDTSTDGRYDPTKRTPSGGTILANRWKKKPKPNNAFEKFDVGHATIYGDLLVQGSLKNVKNYENVLGQKVTDTSADTPTNLAPAWSTVTANIPALDGKVPDELAAAYKLAEKQAKIGGPAAQFEAREARAQGELAAKGMELPGGADPANPTRFKVEKIGVDKKTESLILNNPPGATESWIEIWVTDELKIEKGGTMFVANGVHATIYLEGKVEIKETKVHKGGFILESGFAGDLQLIGIEKPDSKKEVDDDFSPKKRSGKISINDADFTGVINAPDWDIDFKPKDWDKEDAIHGAQLFGSMVGRKVKIGNGADYHYDEALAEIGSVLSYSIAGWNEL